MGCISAKAADIAKKAATPLVSARTALGIQPTVQPKAYSVAIQVDHDPLFKVPADGAPSTRRASSRFLSSDNIHVGSIRKTAQTQLSDVYVMGKKLASGAFGTVYEARHKLLQEKRAIKQVAKEDIDTTDFIRECAFMNELDHPNVLKVHELFEDEENYYCVMELATGGEIFKRFLQRNFKESEAASILKQVLSAVSCCHDRFICHRDIKMENILFDSEKEQIIKLIDFGTAIRYAKDKENAMEGECGTIIYMAPEMFSDRYGPKVDEWSCGVMLYMMLVGHPPFWGADDQQIQEKILNAPVDLSGTKWLPFTPECKDLILKLLERDPSKRMSASDAQKHPWFEKHEKSSPQRVKEQVLLAALHNMTTFSAPLRFQQTVLLVITRHLVTKKESQDIFGAFREIDEDDSGLINFSEFCQFFTSYLPYVDETLLKPAYQAIDVDGSGTISYTEFLQASCDRSILLNKDRIRTAFAMMDIDGDGRISVEDLMEVLYPGKSSSTARTDFCCGLIREVDKSLSGYVSFEDFQECLSQLTPDGNVKLMPHRRRASLASPLTLPSSPTSYASVDSPRRRWSVMTGPDNIPTSPARSERSAKPSPAAPAAASGSPSSSKRRRVTDSSMVIGAVMANLEGRSNPTSPYVSERRIPPLSADEMLPPVSSVQGKGRARERERERESVSSVGTAGSASMGLHPHSVMMPVIHKGDDTPDVMSTD